VNHLRQEYLHRTRRGIGLVFVLAVIVVFCLAVLVLAQNFLFTATSQAEAVCSGQRAYYLAEGAIQEALLEVASQANVPGSAWYARLREPLGAGAATFTQQVQPSASEAAGGADGVVVEPVTVTVCRQHSLSGLAYEKAAVLVLEAAASLPRRVGALAGGIRRTVRRACELRVTLLTPPRPFDQMALFIRKFPYVRKLYDYHQLFPGRFKEFQQGPGSAGQEPLEDYLTADLMRVKEDCCDDRDKLQEGVRLLDRIQGTPVWDGMDGDRRFKDVLDELQVSEERGREVPGSQPEKIVEDTQANPKFTLAEPQWTQFPPAPFSPPDLDKPFFAVVPDLPSEDLYYQPKPTPPFPPDPWLKLPRVDGNVDKRLFDWAGGIANPFPPFLPNPQGAEMALITGPYNEYRGLFDAFVRQQDDLLKQGLSKYFTGFLQCVSDSYPGPGTEDRFKTVYFPRFSKAFNQPRATALCASQAEFQKLVGAGGTMSLNGVYWIAGALDLSGYGGYKGNGFIAATGPVRLGSMACSGSGPEEGTLTILSLEKVSLGGAVRAGLMAPYATVAAGDAAIEGNMIVHSVSLGGWRIRYDAPHLDTGGGAVPAADKLWVNLAPESAATEMERE
jgi:Tfp pilus assembly protein PilX